MRFFLVATIMIFFAWALWSPAVFAAKNSDQKQNSEQLDEKQKKQRSYQLSKNKKTEKITKQKVEKSKSQINQTKSKDSEDKNISKADFRSLKQDKSKKIIRKPKAVSDTSNKESLETNDKTSSKDTEVKLEGASEENSSKNSESSQNSQNFDSTNQSEPTQKTSEVASEKPKPKSISKKLWKGFSVNDAAILKQVMFALQQKNYDEALKITQQIGEDASEDGPDSLRDAVIDIVLWNKFSGNINPKKTSFTAISSFAIDNPFLPNIKEIRRNVEAVAIANSIPFRSSEKYFATFPPLDSESKLFVVESKIESLISGKKSEQDRDLERKKVQAQIAKIWVKENFSVEEEKNFLEKYSRILTEDDHIERVERLLWDNKIADAERIFGLINHDHQNLFEAIIKIAELPRYIDNHIISVPRKLRTNELLLYRVVLWYKSKDRFNELIELMTKLPADSKFAEKWWGLRRLYGREMIKRKEYDSAYKIIARHNLPTSSNDFWEAEWTAGWVALRFADDKNAALKHFINLQKNVSQPVTLSRASYWLGMTYQAMGDKSKAIECYKKAATYPTFFYGQLAIHKHRMIDPLNAANDIILPKDPEITGRDIYKISESRAAQIAYILATTGDKDNASKIFEWIVQNSPTDGQIAVIMKIINELGDRQLDAKISRVAAKKNVFFVRDKFQIVKEVSKDEYAPLVHAIIKQESGFAPSALSKVGAIGFMQLMPDTAKLVAREMGVKYDRSKLATDIRYNILLGSFYIKKLLGQFDNSEMLAIASYNAGPNATLRWINEFYDPRKQKDHDRVVDWIELITYSETRNYVQRIIENMIVYKYLMSRSSYDEVQ